MRARPSASVPIFPMAVAAAPRTPASGSCRAAWSSRTAARPSRIPRARAASCRTDLSSSRRAAPSAVMTEGSTGEYGGTEARSYSSEKISRKRSTGPLRSRSAYSSTSVPRASSRICASPSPSEVTRAGTAARSRSSPNARTTSSRTFASGSRTRAANGGIASRRRLLPSSAAASARVFALGLLRLATRSSKEGLPAHAEGAARALANRPARRGGSVLRRSLAKIVDMVGDDSRCPRGHARSGTAGGRSADAGDR